MSLDSIPDTTLHLLDPADGRLLQSWSFSSVRITIGRGDAESLTLADPYVSRLHAEIVSDSEGWILHSRGRNGVFINGRRIEESRLNPGTTFRLGPAGPLFQFGNAVQNNGSATLSFDPESIILLALDRKEVEQQAQAVTETDYFRTLQSKARELRRQRSSGHLPATE